MFKKTLLFVFFVIGLFLVYFHGLVAYNAREVNFFGVQTNMTKYFPNYYFKYFFNKNYDPLYVWKDSAFAQYAQYCHENDLKCLMMPHQQTYADMVWINSIQYIGSVTSISQSKFLYGMIDNITNLNPYWDFPYEFGELLIPLSKGYTRGVTKEQQQASWQNTVDLGQKGAYYNCDPVKMQKILALPDSEYYKIIEQKIPPWDELKNPCDTHDILSHMAFTYFHYLGDWENAGKYYKIISFNEDVPRITSSMYAIVSGRQGQHIKSMQLWFNKYTALYEKLETITNQEEIDVFEAKIEEALKKAVFEVQLDLLQRASADIQDVECSQDYDCVFDSGQVQAQLNTLINICQSYVNKEITFDKVQTLDEQDDDFANKIRCLILNYAVQNGYINPNTAEFVYPFNTAKEKFKFFRSEEFNDWWATLDV